jgi:hypothetical protein
VFHVLVGLGAAFTLLTLRSGVPSDWAFAVYILVLCLLLISLVTTRMQSALVCSARRLQGHLRAPGVRSELAGGRSGSRVDDGPASEDVLGPAAPPVEGRRPARPRGVPDARSLDPAVVE